MVALPSDTITLPLLPRIISRFPQPLTPAAEIINAANNNNNNTVSDKGLTTTETIVLAVVSVVIVIIIVAGFILCTRRRRRNAAKAPKDAMSSSSSSSSTSSSSLNNYGNIGGGYDPNSNGMGGGYPPPRPLDNHLSPQNEMHEVPLTAVPRYGYGAQVDGLRIPGMAAKTVYSGYSQAPVSQFSPA